MMCLYPIAILLASALGAADGRVFTHATYLKADSRLLVYTRDHPSKGVYCRNLDSGTEERLWPRVEAGSSVAASLAFFSLSPDGSCFSFIEIIGDNLALRVIAMTGEDRFNIPNVGIYAWDPRSRYIAYTTGPISEKDGPFCVPEASFLFDTETKQTCQLPFTAAEFGWCPQSSHLYAFVWEPLGHFSYDLSTRNVAPLSIPSLDLTNDCAFCFVSNVFGAPFTEVYRIEPHANLFDVAGSPLPKKVRELLCAKRWIGSRLLLLEHGRFSVDKAFYLLNVNDGRLWRSPDAFVGCLSDGPAPVLVQYSSENDRFYEQPLNQLKTFDPEGIPPEWPQKR